MVNKTISMDYEMFKRLENEDNASALIVRLLNDYYNSLEIKKEEPKPILEVMEKATNSHIHNQANNKLREAILSELSDDEIARALSDNE